tara:strand:+ start:96 stop:479 length:384 start_codon:yes stop_codon:yes gene_type:complete
MARRRGRKITRRRGPKMTSILGLAEGYVQANILTEAFAGSSALEFVGGEVIPGVSSGGGISLIEIVRRPELLGVIGKNASNPGNLMNVVIMSAVANAGFKFGKRLLRKNVNMVNRMVFKPLALGVKL